MTVNQLNKILAKCDGKDRLYVCRGHYTIHDFQDGEWLNPVQTCRIKQRALKSGRVERYVVLED
jgi:hypothetical protein